MESRNQKPRGDEAAVAPPLPVCAANPISNLILLLGTGRLALVRCGRSGSAPVDDFYAHACVDLRRCVRRRWCIRNSLLLCSIEVDAFGTQSKAGPAGTPCRGHIRLLAEFAHNAAH